MGIVLDILESVAAGYLAAALLQLALAWIVSREGRKLLMHGEQRSAAYQVQTALTWILCGAAGAAAAFVPLAYSRLLYGASSATVVALLMIAIVRKHNRAPHQQSAVYLGLLLTCVLVGSAAVSVLRLERLAAE